MKISITTDEGEVLFIVQRTKDAPDDGIPTDAEIARFLDGNHKPEAIARTISQVLESDILSSIWVLKARHDQESK